MKKYKEANIVVVFNRWGKSICQKNKSLCSMWPMSVAVQNLPRAYRCCTLQLLLIGIAPSWNKLEPRSVQFYCKLICNYLALEHYFTKENQNQSLT